MEKPSTSTLSSLLCQEAEISSSGEDQIPDPSLLSLISCSNGFSDSEEYVQLLLEKEKSISSVLTGNPRAQIDIINIARLQAINYTLKTRELLGFQFQTAFLSITYLDRFLSQRSLHGEKPWAIQLLSVGCLSLAAKVQESNSWGLSSFQVGEFRFQVKAFQRMELLILYTLDWKMGSITPFTYIPYFISILFSKTPPWITLNRILELVMGIVKDVRLMAHYPSAIALASVLLSMDPRFTTNSLELKINAMPCSRFLDREGVSSCYFIMQQSERDPSKIPKLPSSPDLSPINISQMVDCRSSPGTCSISSKRKRLEFDEAGDQSQGLFDKKQRERDT
ncbi:hypothetical protein V2J09_007484 [Rumex salicifolius]